MLPTILPFQMSSALSLPASLSENPTSFLRSVMAHGHLWISPQQLLLRFHPLLHLGVMLGERGEGSDEGQKPYLAKIRRWKPPQAATSSTRYNPSSSAKRNVEDLQTVHNEATNSLSGTRPSEAKVFHASSTSSWRDQEETSAVSTVSHYISDTTTFNSLRHFRLISTDCQWWFMDLLNTLVW